MVVHIGVGSVHKNHTAAINGLDFSIDGDFLLSSGNDGRLCLYSTTQNSLQRVTKCDAHGISLAKFTHDPLSVIVASPTDHAIRYLSLHDKKYLRAYRAHTDKVVTLAMSPKEDMFATAAMDDTARLWDLRHSNCQGVLRFEAGGQRPAIAFDPKGLVVAAAIPSSSGGLVKLYDIRGYDKGPFMTFSPDLGGPKSFSALKFSNGEGNQLLLATTNGVHALIDAFKGNVVSTFTGFAATQGLPLEACFSPDNHFVLAGGEDGAIHRWRLEDNTALPVLRDHLAPVTAIKCNPTRMMVASAATEVCFWVPLPPPPKA